MLTTQFDPFFKDAPPYLDIETIRKEWLALKPPYDVNRWRLPLPVWALRAFEDSGPRAWELLQSDLTHAEPTKPLCIYLHVPFCSSKCGFCDSYSFQLGGQRESHIESYVERLCYELRLWSKVGNLRSRPVSTVHLGGGTPTFLGETGLARLAQCCRECFAITPATEWALETTASSLTPSMITAMHDLGFRRLHVGVQSLEDHVRRLIGRRSSPRVVLDKIEQTLAMGWIVSVDLICGLPGQTLNGFLDGIEHLISAGVNGFSLYELLIYPQNQRWAEQHSLVDRSHIPNYFMFQAGAWLLKMHGFGKNLFNHWADQRDANVYFTFPMRGDDLLAIGTIADGVFGEYHYRHPRYPDYMRAAHEGQPGLEGGLRRTPQENRIKPLMTAVLSSHIPADLLPAFQARISPDHVSLVERWFDSALVQPAPDGGLELTTNGVWFAGNMINELN